jgi:hypothetical protein
MMKSLRLKRKGEKKKTEETSPSDITNFFPRNSKKSLGDLILLRKWKEVRTCLFDRRNELLKKTLKSTHIGEISYLHSICSLHPPVVLVVKTVDLCPQLVLHKDHLGRLPLHIAAGWGASPQVVSFLLTVNIDAASTPDLNGKTPLIWAFENMKSPRVTGMKNIILGDMCGHFDEKCPGPVEEVVQSLVDASLEVVNNRDSAGNNALDYAIENESNPNSLTLLQIATAKDKLIRREMRKSKNLRKPILSISTSDFRSFYKINPLLDRMKKKSRHCSVSITKSSRNHNTKWNHKNRIDEDRFNDQIMDFLGVSTVDCNLDEMSLEYLRDYNIDSLRAAQFGFCASKHCKPPGFPLIVIVKHCAEDTISEAS